MSLHLGLDVSTQSCKAVLINESLEVAYVEKVIFDDQFPEFGLQNGCFFGEGGEVTSSPLVWALSIESVLRKLKSRGVDFQRIRTVCGSAQQHGTVFLTELAIEKLQTMSSLSELASGFFSVEKSPIWMDSSTHAELEALSKVVGGPQEMHELTGSLPSLRFSLPQILKIKKSMSNEFEKTKFVTLVSSFCCSLFLGKLARAEVSDAAGMNLMNLRTLKWDSRLLDAVDSRLFDMLGGEPTTSLSAEGTVSSFWQRFGFSDTCKIYPWVGDNPGSVIGLGLLEPNTILISLGTSDTCLAVLPKRSFLCKGHRNIGHVFPHPLFPDLSVCMLVYSNGDLVRRRIRDRFYTADWAAFSASLRKSKCAEEGKFFYFNEVEEILPPLRKSPDIAVQVSGVPFSLEKENQAVSQDESSREPPNNCRPEFVNILGSNSEVLPEVASRGCLEFRGLSMLLHLRELGLDLQTEYRILMAGGAAQNVDIRQLFADVFGAPVHRTAVDESAAFGGAFKGLFGACVDGLETDGKEASFERRQNLLQKLRSCSVSTSCELPASINSAGFSYAKSLDNFECFEEFLIRSIGVHAS